MLCANLTSIAKKNVNDNWTFSGAEPALTPLWQRETSLGYPVQTHRGFYQGRKRPTLVPKTMSWSSCCRALGPGQVGSCVSLTRSLLRPKFRLPHTRTGPIRNGIRRQTSSVSWFLRRQEAVLVSLSPSLSTQSLLPESPPFNISWLLHRTQGPRCP